MPGARSALRAHPDGVHAAAIGKVEVAPPGRVIATNVLNTRRVLDFAATEQLRRIC